MIRKACALLLLCSGCLGPSAMAQEGHPLVGAWLGDWGAEGERRNFLTVIMYWDGESLSGVVNPGPDSSELQNASLDSSNWSVHLEMDVLNASGEPVRLRADGTLNDIGSYTRTLSGTWSDGNAGGDFTLSRQ